MIKYQHSEQIRARVGEIAAKLGIEHNLSRIACVESTGSKSRHTLARCHAPPRITHLAFLTKSQ